MAALDPQLPHLIELDNLRLRHIAFILQPVDNFLEVVIIDLKEQLLLIEVQLIILW